MTWNMPVDNFKQLVDTYTLVQPRIVAALKELDPDANYAAAASSELLALEDIIALKKEGKILERQPLRGDYNAISKLISARIAALWKNPNAPVDERKRPIGMNLDSPWGALVGFGMSVPVSDGERVYATFGQGQVVAYDLDGNYLWGQLQKTALGNNCDLAHVPSPVLADGVLIVNIDHANLMGFDVKTGKILWKTDIQGPGGYSVGTHKVLRLTKDATTLTVLVTESCKVVRVSDGKIIGTIPYEQRLGGGSSIIGIGDVVLKGALADTYNAPYTAFQLTMVDKDNVTAVKLKVVAKGSVYQGSVVTDQLQAFQPARQADSIIMVGDKLIYSIGGYTAGDKAGEFRIAKNNGGQMQFISSGNKLLYHKPKVPAMEQYAKEIYDLYPVGYTNRAGCPAFFSNVDTLASAQDGRLYVRSTSYLYCIGSAVNGTAKDDATVVAKIRAMSQAVDLLPYLDDASTQNRYVAAQVLAKVDAKAAEAKWKELAASDPSEEIRAIAVRALDAIDPMGKPGSALLQEQIVKGNSIIVTLTLQKLGPAYIEAILLPNLGKDRNEKVCLVALDVASVVGAELCNEKVRDAIIKQIHSDPSRIIVRMATRIVLSWPGDANYAATIAKFPPWTVCDEHESQWTLLNYVNENLPPAERGVFLLDTIKKTDFHRGDVIRWAIDTKPAIPGLVDWIITTAKGGDSGAIQNLTAVTDAKTAEEILLPLLEQPKCTFAAASALYDMKSSELIAATAITKVLPTIAANNGVVQQAMSVTDKFIAHKDPAVRTALLPGFIAVLNNEKALPGAKRMTAERLARLGAEAKPALDALKLAATSTNKEIADSATAAIKAIEAANAK
ncbi:MAG: PQQ-binding-like beta-propeller repeat protein [bacterium]